MAVRVLHVGSAAAANEPGISASSSQDRGPRRVINAPASIIYDFGRRTPPDVDGKDSTVSETGSSVRAARPPRIRTGAPSVNRGSGSSGPVPRSTRRRTGPRRPVGARATSTARGARPLLMSSRLTAPVAPSAQAYAGTIAEPSVHTTRDANAPLHAASACPVGLRPLAGS